MRSCRNGFRNIRNYRWEGITGRHRLRIWDS
jgi:hypothetical protein